MRKIYRIESDYTNVEHAEIAKSTPLDILNLILRLADRIEYAEAYRKEDGSFDLHEGTTDVTIAILDDWEKKEMIDVYGLALDERRLHMEDITEEVLFGLHSENDYKGTEEHMKGIFDLYLDLYLDQDAVLDKICKYGMASLSERDKMVLESTNI